MIKHLVVCLLGGMENVIESELTRPVRDYFSSYVVRCRIRKKQRHLYMLIRLSFILFEDISVYLFVCSIRHSGLKKKKSGRVRKKGKSHLTPSTTRQPPPLGLKSLFIWLLFSLLVRSPSNSDFDLSSPICSLDTHSRVSNSDLYTFCHGCS